LHPRIDVGVIDSSVRYRSHHAAHRTVEAVWRTESARIIAGLTRDLNLAEAKFLGRLVEFQSSRSTMS
jgi:hypothetical protein